MSSERALNPADQLRGVSVSSAMTPTVLSCAPGDDLAALARAMADSQIHCLFVDTLESPDPDGARWAVIADLDLVAAAAAGHGTAELIAASPTVTIEASDTLLRAAELMRDYQTAHLVVLDANEVPVGVVSTLDVASALAAES